MAMIAVSAAGIEFTSQVEKSLSSVAWLGLFTGVVVFLHDIFCHLREKR
jgi:hypothetical protein